MSAWLAPAEKLNQYAARFTWPDLLCACLTTRAASVLFYCPCSAVGLEKLDQYAVLKCPLTTESAMKKIEDNNTLVRPQLSLNCDQEDYLITGLSAACTFVQQSSNPQASLTTLAAGSKLPYLFQRRAGWLQPPWPGSGGGSLRRPPVLVLCKGGCSQQALRCK
jgi:hypothetical protein